MKKYIVALLILMFILQGCGVNITGKDTKDGNQQINFVGHPINFNADSFKMYDEKNGWIEGTVPEYGVYITQNGGKDWLDVTPEGIRNGTFYSLNSTTAFIVSNLNIEKKIYRTTDQGVTWESHVIPNSKSDPIYSVSFVNSNTGWITGQLHSEGSNSIIEILMTTDGGVTWSPMQSVPKLKDGYKNGATLSAPELGWVTASVSGGPLIYHTIDNGENWEQSRLSDLNNSLYFSEPSDPFIINENTIIIPTQTHIEGEIVLTYYLTKDGGNSWLPSKNNINVPRENQHLLFDAVSTEYGWQSTDGSNFYKLTNDFNSVESIDLKGILGLDDLEIINFSFISSSNGFMIIRTENKNILISTSTGGISWK